MKFNSYPSICRILAAVSLSAWLPFVGVSAQSTDVIRLGTQNLPPYQMVVDGEVAGIAMDRVRCAMDAMGQPYEIIVMNWSKAQLMTQNNEIAGFFAGSKNAARARYATPSAPVIVEDLAWYMAKGSSIDPNDADDKLSARYSAKFATSKWLNLKRNGYNVIKKPQDAAMLLSMLITGDIDVALEYELIFAHEMQERGLAESDFQKTPFRSQANMVHFSNTFLASRPQFMARFNGALETCIAAEK